MKRLCVLLFVLMQVVCVTATPEQVVRLGTVICNPGATVTVPVEVDGLRNVSSMSVLITYDPLLLVHLKTEAAQLQDALPKFLTFDEAGSLLIIAYGKENVSNLSGILAHLTFTIRDGSEGLYSDLSLAEVNINEKTLTADLTVNLPLVPTRGMLRSYATTATPKRLDEGALMLAPETTLQSIQLQAGDGLQVSSAQQDPICITGALTAEGVLKVLPPPNGWATATYPVLKCQTADLILEPEGETQSAVVSASTTADGYTLYSLTTAVEGGLIVETESGTTLTADDQNVLAGLLGTAATEANKIVVKGSQSAVELGLDLGIQPSTTLTDGVLTAEFALPELQITSFDPLNGTVQAKIIPPTGATILSKQYVTGVIHVYGSDSLSVPMRKIAEPSISLDNYLKPESTGEVTIRLQFGTKSFFRVVAGRVTAETIEAPLKTETTK